MKVTRYVVFPIVWFIALSFVFDAAPQAQQGQEAPKLIKISNKGYRRKVHHAPVTFTHLAHIEDYGIECTECHHNYRSGENVWKEGDPVRKCIDCHSPIKKQGQNVPRLVFAYHFKCKKCHKENESGPVKCKECHSKKADKKPTP